jgi:hypothetical protein
MSNVEAKCQNCGHETINLMPYSEFGGMRPCKIKEVNNSTGQEVYRDSVEPFYKEAIQLCYPCYRARVRRDNAVKMQGDRT